MHPLFWAQVWTVVKSPISDAPFGHLRSEDRTKTERIVQSVVSLPPASKTRTQKHVQKSENLRLKIAPLTAVGAPCGRWLEV